MVKREHMNFCTSCRKNTEYALKKQKLNKVIKDNEYTFDITVAVCEECGEEINIPGLIDKNIQEIDAQYRTYEGIISIDDIEKLMKLYRIGKAPLSLALGFGEVTITRYLCGQIPSKEYSDIIKRALVSPSFMSEKLEENKDKIASAAYKKATEAAMQLRNLFSVSDKMLRTIGCIFERLEEVTPLALQKLLYFTQGLSCALNEQPMFPEDCQAWTHGPVYPEVYTMFRDFKYNPIDDDRFVIFEGKQDDITERERRIIDLVTNTFGEYSAKLLEEITHKEEPWISARKGYDDSEPSNEIIALECIKTYYHNMHIKYDFSTESGLKRYVWENIS